MRRWFGVCLGAVIGATIAAIPAQAIPAQANSAQANSAQQEARQVAVWRSSLYRAVCAQDWTSALSLSLLMVGTNPIRPQERIQLLALRQDMLAYQRGTAAFPGCTAGGMPIGVTRSAARLATGGSALNWQRSIRSLRGSAAASRTTTSPTATSPAATSSTSASSASASAAPTSVTPTSVTPTSVAPASVAGTNLVNGNAGQPVLR